jgi:hypothetical protein
MSHYRIKIEERNNGEKRYIPQVSRLVNTGGWIKRQRIVWVNIIHNNFYGSRTSSTERELHNREQDALDIIERYKKSLEIEKSKEVKSTSYKMINEKDLHIFLVVTKSSRNCLDEI